MMVPLRAAVGLLLLVLTHMLVRSSGQIIKIPGCNKDPSLQRFLCSNDGSQMNSNMTLDLSSNTPHCIEPGAFCLVANMTDIAIRASSSPPAIIRCLDAAAGKIERGFGFYNVSHLTISNVQFENCGGNISSVSDPGGVYTFTTSPSAYGPNQRAVLLFDHCSHVQLNHVTVTNYYGYAVTGINVLGNSSLNALNITQSRVQLFDPDKYFTSPIPKSFENAGSGILFRYMDTVFEGWDDTNNALLIAQSNITFNTNIFPPYFFHLLSTLLVQHVNPINSDIPIPSGGAGGLTLIFTQREFDVDVVVKHSTIRNNSGILGGGAFISSYDTLNHVYVTIEHCVFDGNRIENLEGYPASGAGLLVSYGFSLNNLAELSINNVQTDDRDLMVITDTVFQNHHATSGAAIKLSCSAQNISDITATMRKVVFKNNQATSDGDCILAAAEPSILDVNSFFLYMEDIHCIGTAASLGGGEQEMSDSAAFDFTNFGHITINGTRETMSIFQNVANSVIRAFATNVFITGNVAFRNNTAFTGAALNLQSSSRLFVQEPAQIEFSNNKAENKGGAIASESIGGPQCVFQFLTPTIQSTYRILNTTQLERLDVNLTFFNNTAEGSGNSIFATPLYMCLWYIESVVQVVNSTDVYLQLFHFPAPGENLMTEVRSEPYQLCFCNRSSNGSEFSIQCPTPMSEVDQPPLRISTFPGRPFSLNVTPVDAQYRPVPSFIDTSVTNKHMFPDLQLVEQTPVQPRVIMTEECNELTHTLLHAENITAQIELSLPSTSMVLTVQVHLQECPFGFKLDRNTGSCECIPIYEERNFECDINDGTIRRPGEAWIGLSNIEGDPTPAYAVRCPTDYCLPAEVQEINVFQEDFLCQGRRTGEICGGCEEGLSVRFGTNDCGQCSNYWLFTIILYALAGIVLVITLFALRLTITTGTINGLIFYAQVVGLNSGLIFIQGVRVQFLLVFVSLLNLDLGFPLCFFDGMNLVTKVALQFVFPIYLWAIVISIIILSRFSRMVQKLTAHAACQVLVTLMYLSYAKVVRSIVIAFIPGYLVTERGPYFVWFFDGTISYFRGNHLFLGLIAIAVAACFALPYKVSLMLVPWCLKYRRTSYFKPLIDAHLGPFKDKWRFWYAMRLVLLTIMIILFVPLASNFPILALLIQLGLVLVFSVVQAYIKPFKNKIINILDLFFMVNSAILIGASAYFQAGVRGVVNLPIGTQRTYANVVVGFLVGLSFVAFCGIILYHILWVTNPTWSKKLEKYKKKLRLKKVRTTEIVISAGNLNATNDGSHTADHEWREYDCRLRESLLEGDMDVNSSEQETTMSEAILNLIDN